MKICNIGWAHSPHVYRMLKWFATKGNDVHVITNSPFHMEGVKIYDISVRDEGELGWQRYKDAKHNILLRWLTRMDELKRIRKIVDDIDPDIIHSHSLWYPGYMGSYLNFHPYVVTVFNGDVLWEKDNLSLYDKMRTIGALKKADLVLGETKTLIDAAINRGVNREKAHVMKIGVDFRVFNQQVDRMALRKKLSLPLNANIVLSPRTIAKFYNLKTLLRAIPKVMSKTQNTLIIFIGNHVDNMYLEELKRESEALNATKNVLFVGKVSHTQVAEYHRAADVFVSVSPKDSGPMALQEAMACGAAPVISNLPSVRELVKNGWNGFLIDPSNVEDIASAICRTFKSEEMRKNFAERNWKIVTEKCDYEKEMSKTEGLYYKLIKENKK